MRRYEHKYKNDTYKNRAELDKEATKRTALHEWVQSQEEARFLKHNSASVELIKYSNRRGMSRNAMNRIWGEKLVNAVLGQRSEESVRDRLPS